MDSDSIVELMRLVAAHQWPEKYRSWLGAMRVRVGFGPSGEAASERRVIDVPNVFANPDLEDWHDVARELSFTALTALPLIAAGRALGVATFYFPEASALTSETRSLLRLVADLLAALGIDETIDLTAAVDGELAERATPLRDGAEVMLLAAMEGGAEAAGEATNQKCSARQWQ